jgi:hypothetical protein
MLFVRRTLQIVSFTIAVNIFRRFEKDLPPFSLFVHDASFHIVLLTDPWIIGSSPCYAAVTIELAAFCQKFYHPVAFYIQVTAYPLMSDIMLNGLKILPRYWWVYRNANMFAAFCSAILANNFQLAVFLPLRK